MIFQMGTWTYLGLTCDLVYALWIWTYAFPLLHQDMLLNIMQWFWRSSRWYWMMLDRFVPVNDISITNKQKVSGFGETEQQWDDLKIFLRNRVGYKERSHLHTRLNCSCNEGTQIVNEQCSYFGSAILVNLSPRPLSYDVVGRKRNGH
jgi:hypothetical protein